LPRIDEVLQLVLMSKILSKIDIHQAFHGVEIEEKSRPLTTFRTTFGVWQWNVMPFGLSNAPSTWQRVINDTLFEGLGSFCYAYVDDIIIWSPSVEQHRRDVWTVLQRLRDEGLSINVEKCEFDVKETRYLGHVLSTAGIRPVTPHDDHQGCRGWLLGGSHASGATGRPAVPPPRGIPVQNDGRSRTQLFYPRQGTPGNCARLGGVGTRATLPPGTLYRHHG